MAGAIWYDVDQRMAEATWSTSMGKDRRMTGAKWSDVDRRMARATWFTFCPAPCKDRSMAGAIWSYVDRRMAEATWSTSCTMHGGKGPQDFHHACGSGNSYV
ncbi:hypothetical protein DPMN_120929 [Dreissena polymorpha]|uniref:Uncharacterized protein n=1 Tax=Dreissena polymorpha TaxID=45954 RepID=A0A9D4GKR3_DREPO|nr:hypothetical protein DPMN_120929 [Dreissena polymorpha]